MQMQKTHNRKMLNWGPDRLVNLQWKKFFQNYNNVDGVAN